MDEDCEAQSAAGTTTRLLDFLGGNGPVLLLAPVFLVLLVALGARSGVFRGGGPDFDELTVSPSFERFQTKRLRWSVSYERNLLSTFTGRVRYVSPIRERNLDILSHDILVTSGDYADPAVVSTNVSYHMFTWGSRKTTHPRGGINLLHTVPPNREVYDQLRGIRNGDEVTISGWEVLVVTAFDPQGNQVGEWKDMDCNTVLVDSVEVTKER